MTIFLSGSDNVAHHRIMANCGATHFAVNISALARRSTKRWTLDYDPDKDWEWIAYADSAVTADQILYALDNSSKPPLYFIGGDTLEQQEGYIPLWNGQGDLPQNRELGLCVTDTVFRDGKLARRALATRLQGGAMGVLTGSIDPDIARYDFVISGAWWSVLKYGETQIWDGRTMHRFNADRQREVRTQYRDCIEALGLDFDLVLAGDVDESAKMAISSWQAYGRSFTEHRVGSVTPLGIVASPEENETPISGFGPKSLTTTPPLARHEMSLLPVIGADTITSHAYDAKDGKVETQRVLRSSGDTVRRCDNCVLATAGCPGYKPEHLCAYKIPVEIRSKDQLANVMTAVLEMQTQRVFQARFFEEVTGQELGPDVGLESDRLFRLIEKMAQVLDNRESLKMTVEAKSSGGMLSRLFGDKAGQAARALTNPLDPNRVIDTTLGVD